MSQNLSQNVSQNPSGYDGPAVRSCPSATAGAAAFPLGGIGTGTVSLGARGEWRDWEIRGHADQGFTLPNTFWAVRTAPAGGTGPVVAKVLEAPLRPPYTAWGGIPPEAAAGLPHVDGAELRGAYPFAEVAFTDADLPVDVRLEAFTPLVPLDADASGLPCAVLTHTVTNTSGEPVDVTLAASLVNPLGGQRPYGFGHHFAETASGNRNEYRDRDGVRGLYLSSSAHGPDAPDHGSLALVTAHGDVTAKPARRRGIWFDHLRDYWRDLVSDGRLDDLGYEDAAPDGSTDTGALAVHDTLAPGATGTYTWVLAWHHPNRPPGWTESWEAGPPARAYYANRYDDAWAVAADVAARLDGLTAATRAYRDALYGSTLPAPLVDAVASNVVPVRSNTCFRLADGRLHGWEGTTDTGGSCEGTCTHVWSYAYAVAYLFPELERGMRHGEFTQETDDDGWTAFRAHRVFGREYTWGGNKPEAAVDGQCGNVVRAYREYLLSADDGWLQEIWPGLTRALAYATSHWDTDGDGVPDGKQHNTYDIEFYGPNPLCTVYLLAALRAGERLALALGADERAATYAAAFERVSRQADELLWNGEFYVQRLADVDAHPYQHGLGCLSDQLLGQLHATLLGLGDLLPPEHVRSALAAIHRHNFRRSFRDHSNAQRTYALEDEAGLLMCSWPDGGEPEFPFVYSDEAWTGTEYQVAAHLLSAGLVDEALEVVGAVRARYDGVRRNPWDEIECGHHYARSMASFALLLAATGFHCDLPAGVLAFDPPAPLLDRSGDVFRAPWFGGRAWGVYEQRRTAGGWEPEVTVLGGDASGLRVRACGREWSLG